MIAVYGDIGRVPFLKLDPMPQVEASINGGPPKHLTFYTGAPNLSLTASVAKEAGLSPVASQKIDCGRDDEINLRPQKRPNNSDRARTESVDQH